MSIFSPKKANFYPRILQKANSQNQNCLFFLEKHFYFKKVVFSKKKFFLQKKTNFCLVIFSTKIVNPDTHVGSLDTPVKSKYDVSGLIFTTVFHKNINFRQFQDEKICRILWFHFSVGWIVHKTKNLFLFPALVTAGCLNILKRKSLISTEKSKSYNRKYRLKLTGSFYPRVFIFYF